MNGCTVPPFIHAPLTATSLHACILMAFSAVCSRLNRNCHNHTDLQRSPPQVCLLHGMGKGLGCGASKTGPAAGALPPQQLARPTSETATIPHDPPQASLAAAALIQR